MFLTEIALQNFKIHKNTRLNPKKITIFIGPNGSGKSSILQALLILKKSLERQAPIDFVTSDKTFDLGKYDDIVGFGRINKPLSISIQGKRIIPIKIGRKKSAEISFKYSITYRNREQEQVNFAAKMLNLDIKFDWGRDDGKCVVKDTKEDKILEVRSSQLHRINPRFNLTSTKKLEYNKLNEMFQNGNFTETMLKNFHVVPFLRTAATYGVKLSPMQDELLSKNLDETISKTISRLSKDPVLLDTISDLMYDLWRKRIRPRNIDLFEEDNEGITLDFIKDRFANSIVHEGTGINQTVLLLAILTGAEFNSIIGIEEPEIHLHPKAQSKLAKIIMRISKNHGKQIFFTTHSEHMLYPFLASVASKRRGSLKKEDLAIYYFEEGYWENNNVYPLEINEHGQIKGGLKGFWDADLETLSEFL